jgi:hypothetical protein
MTRAGGDALLDFAGGLHLKAKLLTAAHASRPLQPEEYDHAGSNDREPRAP